MNEQNTFFAEQLLKRLESEQAIKIAYESQVESANVGFDFATANIAFERLSEEIVELEESLSDYNKGDDTLEHLCDEATDVIFGVINVLRHTNSDMSDFFTRINSSKSAELEHTLEDQQIAVDTSFKVFQKSFDQWVSDNATQLIDNGVVLATEAILFVSKAGLVPNNVMKKNVEKYLLRCKYIEDGLISEDKQWSDISLDEIYARWKAAKQSGL